MFEQFFQIENFSAAQNAGQIGVVVRRTEQDGGRGDRRNDDRGAASGNLPQGGSTFFLNFRMRRQILERQHITCGQGDDRVGIGGSSEFAKGAEYGKQFFGGTVVGDDQDEGTLSGAAQENDHQRFGGSGES